MSIASELAADVAEVIGDHPVTLTQGANSYTVSKGPAVEAHEFEERGIEYRVESSVLMKASDAAQIAQKSKVTISGTTYRVHEKQPDSHSAGVVVTLASPTK